MAARVGVFATVFLIAATLTAAASDPLPGYSKDELASRLAIAQDYVRYLTAGHQLALDLKAQMMAEKEKGEHSTLSTMSMVLTRKSESLGLSIAVLKAARLSPPDALVVSNEVTIYEQDKAFYEEAAKVMARIGGGEKPLPADAARFDEAMRRIVTLDHTILALGPFVIALIADKHYPAPPDARRLLITKAQRQELIGRIDATFKQDGDNTDNTGNVDAAYLLKYALSHNALASDE